MPASVTFLVNVSPPKGRFTKVKFIRNQKYLAVEKEPFPAYALQVSVVY